MKFISTILSLLVTLSPLLYAKKTHSGRKVANTPEQQLAGFTVPEGFVIELVASEKDGIINPIDLTFDDAGRLWTQTAKMYPLDPVANIKWNDLLRLMDNPEAQRKNPNFKRILDLYEGKTKGEDKIIVLSDLYGKGKIKSTVWADGLTIPQSILPYKDGAFVAQGSELFVLRDVNKDGKADKRVRMLTGFGITDTHTMAHTLVRAPGGWVHFSQGALNKGMVKSLISGEETKIDYSKIARFSLDGKHIELISAGHNNIWGFQLRGNGQWYSTEANDYGMSVTPMEEGTAFKGIGNQKLRPYQPWLPVLHKFRVGGTGISGLAFSDSAMGSFPAEWRDVALLANPITSTINAVKIVRNPDGSVTAKHLPDLLKSKDDWFRPVNIEFGPDGCLYIADWYNKIVSHNELPTTHPDRDKKHGRIWRIRHKSQKLASVPNFYKVPNNKLVDHLKAPILWEKRAAWHQIADRNAKELAPSLVTLINDKTQDEITRIVALWSLEALGQFDSSLMETLMKSPQDNLRREAVRALIKLAPDTATLNKLITPLVNDANVMVRSQVLRTLSEFQKADHNSIDLLVTACKPEIKGDHLGGPYERKFERYLARKALEQYQSQLETYLVSPAAKKQPITRLLWAIQALSGNKKDMAFLKFWKAANFKKVDEPTFIAIAKMLSNKSIYDAVVPTLQNTAHAAEYVKFAIKHQAQIQSPQLATLLQPLTLHLLKSGATQALALDAISRLKIKGTNNAVAALINPGTKAQILGLAMKALEANPKQNEAIFAKAFNDKTLPFSYRLQALHAYAKANQAAALQALTSMLPSLNEHQKKEIATTLSGSPQGAGLLMHVHDKKLLETKAFDLSSAERTHAANKQDPRGKAILDGIRALVEQEKKNFQKKLEKYIALAEKNGGNPFKGREIFQQSCLACHKLGEKGQEIAPALDGSGHRDNEALITALLDPNAAIEGGYVLYRVVRKNGNTVEGYLSKKDERGTTIAFMGGSTVFIPKADIKQETFVGGRSFMPAGMLDGLNDERAEDLLAYIRTLRNDVPPLPEKDPNAKVKDNDQAKGAHANGLKVYQANCQVCHQDKGQGLHPAFPPLAKSEWVSGPVENLIRIQLRGLSGNITVAGKEYNGVMPANATMSDQDIADVLTYIRSNFGNKAGAVKPEQVKALRGEVGKPMLTIKDLKPVK